MKNSSKVQSYSVALFLCLDVVAPGWHQGGTSPNKRTCKVKYKNKIFNFPLLSKHPSHFVPKIICLSISLIPGEISHHKLCHYLTRNFRILINETLQTVYWYALLNRELILIELEHEFVTSGCISLDGINLLFITSLCLGLCHAQRHI